MKETKWACPKCGATPSEHGRNECRDMISRLHSPDRCLGFVCECCECVEDEDDNEHGATLAKPCHAAVCWHCGWHGTFPKPPGRIPAWAKKALEAGWTPPEGWMP